MPEKNETIRENRLRSVQKSVLSFLAAIESGRRKPSLDVLIRLVNAIGASFDEILAPQTNTDSEIVDRIRRLVPQCSQRDQELLLALIDKMLDTKENNANK